MNKFTIKKRQILSESAKAYTILWRPKRVFHLPKKEVVSQKDGGRLVEFTLTNFAARLFVDEIKHINK